MIDVSVGLCSRNRKSTLELVLLSLADQTLAGNRYEAVVVDDGSTDGTEQMIGEIVPKLPYSLTYCKQSHSGLATARNTGLRASKGKVVLYIDDDVLADPDLLSEHLAQHERFDRCVCNGWVNHVEEAVRPAVPQFTMADISTSFFWTSNVSVKRAHLIEAGAFDEDFKEYGWEDQELGLRLMAIGLVKRNNFRAVGYHVKRPPTRANIEGALGQSLAKARSALIYIKKHPRMRSRMATGLIPYRLAWAEMANIGHVLESYCRRQLGVSENDRLMDATSLERRLTGHELWCLRHLCSIVYFRTLTRPPLQKDTNQPAPQRPARDQKGATS
jgi:glycosyltransferase involved in cell wall biosynthesis